MKTLVSIILGFVIISFYYLYIRKVGDNKVKFNIKTWVSAFAIGGSVIVFVYFIYIIGSNSGLSKSETINLFQNLDSSNVDRIKIITFSRYKFKNFTKDTTSIYNKCYINDFAHEFKKMYPINRGSMLADKWTVIIELELKTFDLTNVYLEVNNKENGECEFRIMKHTWYGEFNLGLYRSDELGKVIEKVHNSLLPSN
jgi:hypothetical protein